MGHGEIRDVTGHHHTVRHPGESRAFHFESTWQVPASADAVWDAMARTETWATWWPGISATEVEQDGDERTGVGTRVRCTVRSPLVRALVFTWELTRAEQPRVADVAVAGDLRGIGRWRCEDGADGTARIHILWCVTTRRWPLRIVRLIARKGHDTVMRRGRDGLARSLAAT